MIRLNFASSVDGYIATPDDGVDWLAPYQTEDLGFHAFIERIALVIMGRRTYEKVESFGSWPYGKSRGLILSSRPLKPAFPHVERTNEPLDVLIERLRREPPDGDVWVEGGKTMASFLQARAVDLIEHYVAPVALGNGIPMFGDMREAMNFETRSIEQYPSGVIKHTYVQR